MSQERRRDARADLLLKVTYDEPRDLLADYLTDLGGGGMFLRTSETFEIGETVQFAVSFPDLIEPIPIEGVVRWRRDSATDPGGRSGVGVEFVFRDQDHRNEIQSLLAKSETSHDLPAGARPFQVLLVEDNQFAQELFQHSVERFAAQLGRGNVLDITSVSSAPEALKVLNETDVDLAIIDYFLPEMNGAELVRTLRAEPRFHHMPILIISVGGDGVREDALAAGADLYIDKPILLKQLLNTLRILLASRTNVGGDA